MKDKKCKNQLKPSAPSPLLIHRLLKTEKKSSLMSENIKSTEKNVFAPLPPAAAAYCLTLCLTHISNYSASSRIMHSI